MPERHDRIVRELTVEPWPTVAAGLCQMDVAAERPKLSSLGGDAVSEVLY